MSDQIVYVTATEEPFGPEDVTRIHVSVAFDTEDETTAEHRFEVFVRAMATAEFLVCEVVQDAGLTTVRPVEVGGRALLLRKLPVMPPLEAPDVPGMLLDWIGERLANGGGTWESRRRSVDDAITPRMLSAGTLVGAVKGWNAPLAGLTGLSVLGEVDTAALPGADWIVVPVFAAQDISATEVTQEPAEPTAVELRFTANLGREFAGVEIHARREARAPFDTPLRDDGFFDLHDGEAGLLRTIRARAAAALALPAELLGWPGDDVDAQRWRAANAVITLLDPTITALTMGATDREGPFVKIINAALENVGASSSQLEEVSLWINERVRNAFLVGDDGARLAAAGRALGLIASDGATTPIDSSSLLAAVVLGQPLPRDTSMRERLDAEISAVLQRLEGESGVEEVVLRALALAGITDEAGRAELGWPDHATPMAELKARLASDYNGADAVRQAVGSVIEQALAGYPPAAVPATPIADAVRAADWYATRLGLVEAPPLQAWFNALPPPIGGLPPGQAAEALGWFSERYSGAAAELLPAQGEARVIPAAVPQPIVVQFGVGHDQGAGDRFDDQFQGVGVLVRRSTPDAKPWAHANLATLVRVAAGLRIPVALHPMRPASEDGQRRLAIDYQGFPLASTKAQASADGGGAGRSTGPDALAFATFDDPLAVDLPPFEPLPALYYGATYHVAAFAVASSGALPALLRSSDVEPWSLRPELGSADIPGQIETVCSRETAIGRVALSAEAASGQRSALDAAIPEVEPLARAYPRLALAAPAGGTAWLDLGRMRSGGGTLRARDTLTLASLLRWGGGETSVALFDGESDETPAVDDAPLGDDPQITLPDGDATARFWIRLRLSAGKSTAAGLSFADPALPGDGGETPGFVLLRPSEPHPPKNGPVFRPELPGEVRAIVHHPRMGFLDFDRWLSNPQLQNASGGSGATGPIHEKLMTAFAHGELEPLPSHGSAVTIEHLNQLPDLAVEALQLVLAPIDTLTGIPGTREPRVLDLPLPKLASVAAATAREILDNIAERYQTELRMTPGDDLALTLASGVIVAEVPPGMIARLSIRPLVAKTRFADAVISKQVEGWAVGEAGDHLVFDGPAIVIEAMAVPEFPSRWPGDEPIAIRPAGRERRYRIVAGGAVVADRGLWRQFGSVEIESQRWRFQGKPVTERLSPKTVAVTSRGPDDLPIWRPGYPAVPLASDPAVLTFEKHLFLGRSAADSQMRTVLLDPLPGETVLVDMPWEPPSATYVRHALTLRSRYWGALREPTRSGVLSKAQGDGFETGDDYWWGRVAILADRARIDLTRPQLRALMPLTIDATGAAGTPPVLALLAEPPYAQGGLADRVAAEIKTGFGHEISAAAVEPSDLGDPGETGEAELRLRIRDSRKEAGPDPRLTYEAMPAADALALTLDAHGPIGLGFDRVGESATYPNCAFVLTPRSGKRRLAEHFFSISMRRYLDHAWTVDEPGSTVEDAAAGGRFPYREARWFELPPGAGTGAAVTLTCDGLTLAQIDSASPVADAAPKPDNDISIWVDRNAILTPAPATTPVRPPDLVRVATVPSSSESAHFAILHQPLDASRGALSVFRVTEKATVMLVSYEWSAGDAQPTALEIEGSAVSAYPVSASTATAMAWTRTGVDADVLHFAADATPGEGAPPPARIDRTSASRTKNGVKLITKGAMGWARPALAFAREPLHVQRHLAVIGTRFLAQGSEEYMGAWFTPGGELPVGAQVEAIRMLEFELVAQPVCSENVVGAPARYTSAIFDLDAIGRVDFDLLFFLRPLGSWRAAGASRSLGLTADGRRLDIALGAGAAALILLLVKKDGGVEGLAIDEAGQTRAAPVTVQLADGTDRYTRKPRFPIGEVAVGRGETWVEIALMTLDPPPRDAAPSHDARSVLEAPIALPLDRFFSAEGNAALAPAQAVRPDTLARLNETEARLISVSAPLKIPPPAN